MTTLIMGASGATGRLLSRELIKRGREVKAIARPGAEFPVDLRDDPLFSVTRANILNLSVEELSRHLKDCDSVMSCLGHSMNFKGIWGPPYRLVTDAVRRACQAIAANQPARPVRFVLMSSAGVRNPERAEKISPGQGAAMGLIRLLVPPHPDNEQAAGYLRREIGMDHPFIQWAAVRPDSLIDETEVSGYEVYASPVRDVIFDPGKTSRINTAHFMAELVSDHSVWEKWHFSMPVIYNRS